MQSTIPTCPHIAVWQLALLELEIVTAKSDRADLLATSADLRMIGDLHMPTMFQHTRAVRAEAVGWQPSHAVAIQQ
jgi:hypothetical protein